MCEKEIVQSKMNLVNFPLESLSKEALIEIIKGYDKAQTLKNTEVDELKKRNTKLEIDNEDLKENVDYYKQECSLFIKNCKSLCKDIKILQTKYYEDINGYFMNELRDLKRNYGYGQYDSDDSDGIDDE